MTKIIMLLNFLSLFPLAHIQAEEKQDYQYYHEQVIEAETLVVKEHYADALLVYEHLFDNYSFMFLREYQMAAQLALIENENEKAIRYLRRGILSGWDIRSIKKNKFLTALQSGKAWDLIEKDYPYLRKQYESNLNQDILKQVKTMYSKDQKKAFKALFRIGSKAKNTYAEKKFAPHSEKQMAEFSQILQSYGYPGEKLIGNDYWMSTILSHHNSISTTYNKKDSIYPALLPKFKKALNKGQMSPYEFAMIDDWYRASRYQRKEPGYGILNRPSTSSMSKTNELRKKIYARPFELRDGLEAIEIKTGMNFYLLDRWY